MIATGHPEVSVERRCRLLGLPRASYYRGPASGLRNGDLELMRWIDELYLQHPWMGSRSLADHLTTPEAPVGRGRVRHLMLVMGIESLAPKPGTSRRQPKHPVYPYLLRGVTIDRPNQVWATDITYIPMSRGFMYLIAIMDWATRKVLSWRLSNTLDTRFCVEALKEALFKYGAPEIFNTDQGCQFTSESLHFRPQDLERQDQHGRQGAVQGQHLHRKTLAYPEIRKNLPEGLRNRRRAFQRPDRAGSLITTRNGNIHHLTNGHRMRLIPKGLKN